MNENNAKPPAPQSPGVERGVGIKDRVRLALDGLHDTLKTAKAIGEIGELRQYIDGLHWEIEKLKKVVLATPRKMTEEELDDKVTEIFDRYRLCIGDGYENRYNAGRGLARAIRDYYEKGEPL